MKKRSYKTTVSGLLAAVGVLIALYGKAERGEGLEAHEALQGVEALGWLIAALGLGATGVVARDDDVTSEGTEAPKKRDGDIL
jgi:hypothetical protein